jgi:hypothetical protein
VLFATFPLYPDERIRALGASNDHQPADNPPTLPAGTTSKAAVRTGGFGLGRDLPLDLDQLAAFALLLFVRLFARLLSLFARLLAGTALGLRLQKHWELNSSPPRCF